MIRCNKCILPENYPGIQFNDEGICNFCLAHKKIKYFGEENLKRDILNFGKRNSNGKYDCALGFSGGRDSTYLLYLLSRILKLKVLAITVDNGFLPLETKNNIINITKKLEVDSEIVEYNFLKKNIKHHLEAFAYKPEPSMISALCVGCRLGIAKGKYEVVKDNKIPVLVNGGTPFEGNQFKTKLLKIDPNSHKKSSLVLGYAKQILINYKWVTNPYSVFTQIREANTFYNSSYLKKLKKRGVISLSPFHKYIYWEEKAIIETIVKELDWKKNPSVISTWRGDCEIALLKLYLYKKLLGYNDKDDSLSDLIRDGQISRKEALQRLDEEQYIPETIIIDILKNNKIDYKYFLSQVEKSIAVKK